MSAQTISHSLKLIHNRIIDAAVQFGRDPAQITLLAVSKTKPVDAIMQAYQAGQRQFGENYLQEALIKIQALQAIPLEWHYIGKIQSNKLKQIAQNFTWVHTLEHVQQGKRLNQYAAEYNKIIQVCIEVNISGEESKGGVWPSELLSLASAINALSHLQLRGLMAIPKPSTVFAEQRAAYQRLRVLFDQLKAQGIPLDTLSMGMSQDLSAAIAEGATIVRIGTDIFGSRETK